MTEIDSKLLFADPETLTDTELVEVLAHLYRSEVVPPCRECGGPLSVASAGGGATIWACSGQMKDPNDPSRLVWKEGRQVADDHYAHSRWSQYRHGDIRVLELLNRFTALQPAS